MALTTVDKVAANIAATVTGGTTPNRTFTIFGISITEPSIQESVDNASSYVTELLSADLVSTKTTQATFFETDVASLFVVGKAIAGLGIKSAFNYSVGELSVSKPVSSQIEQTVERLNASVTWWRKVLLPFHRVKAQEDISLRGADLLLPTEAGIPRIAPDSPWQGA